MQLEKFGVQPKFNYLNSRHIRYSDPHCLAVVSGVTGAPWEGDFAITEDLTDLALARLGFQGKCSLEMWVVVEFYRYWLACLRQQTGE